VEGSDPSVNALGVCLGKGKWRIKKMQDDLGEPVSIVVMDRNDPVQNIINALLPGAVLPHQVQNRGPHPYPLPGPNVRTV
jgi:transcription antitermination factor NusA-like protein